MRRQNAKLKTVDYMSSRASRLDLSRSQILSFRLRANSLHQRLPAGAKSLRQAAWAGLQDSMPRAALLSLHARVEGVKSADLNQPSLVQLWGPRFSNYVVAAQDLAIFSLGRLPDDHLRRARAQDTASRLHAFLAGRRMPFGKAGHAMGVPPNSLRYAAPTGTVLISWNGAQQPLVWTIPRPEVDPRHARLELGRRYLHIFGPASSAAFAKWAGIRRAEGRAAFQSLAAELTPVRTPIGDAWILAADESVFHMQSNPTSTRLLPSGDAYYLLWGADRELLVPEAKQRSALWTTRVWPGALLLQGEIIGVWHRSSASISTNPRRTLSSA